MQFAASRARCSLRCLLNNPDFLFGQAVEFVDELVDLFVGCIDLALDQSFFTVHVPAEGPEQRIDELQPGLGLVVPAGQICIRLSLNRSMSALNSLGWSFFHLLMLIVNSRGNLHTDLLDHMLDNLQNTCSIVLHTLSPLCFFSHFTPESVVTYF